MLLLGVMSRRVIGYVDSPGCFAESNDNFYLLSGSYVFSTLRWVKGKYIGGMCMYVFDDKSAHPKNVIHTLCKKPAISLTLH